MCAKVKLFGRSTKNIFSRRTKKNLQVPYGIGTAGYFKSVNSKHFSHFIPKNNKEIIFLYNAWFKRKEITAKLDIDNNNKEFLYKYCTFYMLLIMNALNMKQKLIQHFVIVLLFRLVHTLEYNETKIKLSLATKTKKKNNQIIK